jgi:predicted lipoprotein with Yx(FWY)xxD motif
MFTEPLLRPFLRRAAFVAGLALLTAACTTGSGGTGQPSAVATAAATPAPSTPVASSPAASDTGGSTGGRPYPPGDGASGSASPAASGAAADTYEVKVATSPTAGAYLTGEDGRTLYVYDHDTAAATSSACSGTCASNWPAFVLEGAEQVKADDGVSGTLAAVTLANGTRQVAYQGRLLYYFKGDAAAGQTSGDGLSGVWHVAKP